MPKEYTKEQLWKLYEKLPEELKEATFSMKTADSIWDVCEKNEVEEVSIVAKYAGYVLMGVLSPEDFQETIEKELGLEKEVAKKIAQEINRFIFYPVKPLLEELYKIEIIPPAKSATITPSPEEKPKAPPEEKPKAPPEEDIYREPVE